MTMTETADARRRRGSLRRSALDRTTAMTLAATEYGRYLAQLRSLAAADWERPTDCPDWDVRAMAAHNLGMAEMAASFRELLRQNLAAGRRPEQGVDALTALQVEERAAMSPEQIVARYAAIAAPATRGRRRRSVLMGRLPMPDTQAVNGTAERWAFGFIFDTILTRDTWMHRVDTAQATGRPMMLSAEHDGVIVADVVREWAQRHGRPHTLRLRGPAGGSWSRGTSGPEIAMDAVEFCRTLSRRAPGTDLLDVEVPF